MTLLQATIPTMRDDPTAALPVAVVGGGPVGLAAAAHLVERGIPFEIYESGASIAAAVRSWGHTRLFSPWRHLVDTAAARLLERRGWTPPDPDVAPTGAELVDRYLEPLSQLPGIAPRIVTDAAVVAVSRERADRTRTAGRARSAFLLRVRTGDTVRDVRARAVIDASGTYRTPNPLAASGLEPLGAEEVREHVVPALPDVLGADRARFAGRHALVVGAGHSAANTLLQLDELAREEPGTRASWVVRNARATRVSSSADDELPARASIGRRIDRLVADTRIALVDRFETVRLRLDGDGVVLVGERNGALEEHRADVIVNATGFRPDLDMLREIRLELDEVVEAPRRLAPLIDPNLHSCGTVPPHGYAELRHPEPDFFLAGMKSYGRAPTFLLATGYEQVRSIVAHLAGDETAAANVELVLPATGVCSTDAAAADGAGASSCCAASADGCGSTGGGCGSTGGGCA